MPIAPTCILYDEGNTYETRIGHSFEECVEAVWTGDYFGNVPGIIEVPTGQDRTAEALAILRKRTFDQGSNPRHLDKLFWAHDLDPFDEDKPRRDPNAEHRLSYAQLLGRAA